MVDGGSVSWISQIFTGKLAIKYRHCSGAAELLPAVETDTQGIFHLGGLPRAITNEQNLCAVCQNPLLQRQFQLLYRSLCPAKGIP
ncbi:hypothetical protein EEY24_10105 [Shewanella algae]|nr:hypothetical protein EEY24_10105 [Shewanella algae]